MKTRISKENLLKGIQAVYSVIPSRSTLPILSHILLEAKKDILQVAGTDLEMGIYSSIPAEVLDEGALAVPAKRLYDLVKELPNESLLLTAKKKSTIKH